MDFFAHQEQARRQTRRMLVMFGLAVALLVAATNVVVLIGFGVPPDRYAAVIGVTSLVALTVIGVASLYRISSLRAGGTAVALQLGATPVPAGTGDFSYQRLRNVVEEIAIASGVPMPDVFVLEGEDGINAFAAGYAPTDAAVTVTRGALDKLTRSELQGVIAHEFSHVLNGDMRLNIRLVGVVFGIVVLSMIGRRILQGGGRSRSRDAGGVMLVAVALIVIGWLGVACARIIKASISRQREYLADASSVQFTRDTGGIAGALKKIGALSAGSRLQAAGIDEVSHMLFGDGVGHSSLFSTHPPVLKRIRRLQPRFDETEMARIAAAWRDPVRVGDSDDANVSIAGFAPATGGTRFDGATDQRTMMPAANAMLRVQPSRITRQVGNPGDDDHSLAHAISASIPDPLRRAAEQQESAPALLLALALGAGDTGRDAGLRLLAARYDSGTLNQIDQYADRLKALHPLQRLPLAALAFPSLRRRPRREIDVLVQALDELVHADGIVELSEYCLVTLVQCQVVEALDPAASAVMGRTRLPEVKTELADLYSTVARHGHADEEAAVRAFRLGIDEALPMATLPFDPPTPWTEALDRALPRLDRLAPAGKELVIAGLVRALSADGAITVAESELLRMICARLHCPLPPLLTH